MPLPTRSEQPGYLTIVEVAERCRVPYGTAYHWIKVDRCIPGAEQGPNRAWRVRTEDFERWLEQETSIVPRKVPA